MIELKIILLAFAIYSFLCILGHIQYYISGETWTMKWYKENNDFFGWAYVIRIFFGYALLFWAIIQIGSLIFKGHFQFIN